MIIEKAEIRDAERLLEIYAPYVRDTAVSFEYQVPEIEEFEKRIAVISARFPYIKAVENGKTVGYAYANTFRARTAYDRCVEVSIYVGMDCRRRGIGRALYASLEKSLCSMNITNMNACITMPRGKDTHLTEDSFNFHGKMGFSLAGRFQCCGYKFGKWYDMVWMEKIIAPHGGNPPEVTFGRYEIYD